MVRGLCGVILAAIATSASAADQPAYAPAPAWVVRATDFAAPAQADEQPVRVMLQDNQVRFGPDADEAFTETLMRAQTPQGLQALGSVAYNWDPQTDLLIIHGVKILRGAQVIDVLAAGKTFTVLRREENLEQSMIDGRLTATLQLEDLRVGDIVDVSATIRHHDPSFKARPDQVFGEPSGVVVDHLRMRAIWPSSTIVDWRESDGLVQPKLRSTDGETELAINMESAKAPKPPKWAPARFSELGQLQLSGYRSWSEVSAALAPLFTQAANLAADSTLHDEVRRIRAVSSDPAVQAGEALKLVEDKVRYVYLSADLGGYKPARADLTWSRRFGDCKGKTVLLVALLRELGLEAAPVLVSTQHGDGLDSRLPALAFFNHAIVRLSLAGRTYWLDATRTGDRDLWRLNPPAFRWALPLAEPGAGLVPIVQGPLETPMAEARLRVDATAGLTAPAPAHAEVVLRGDGALGIEQLIRASTQADIEKVGRQFWEGQYRWIAVKSLSTTFDPQTSEAKLVMDGLAQLDWREDDAGVNRRHLIAMASVPTSPDLKREADTRQDAPYASPFPVFTTATETLILPDHGRGYSLEGRDFDRTIGATRYVRASTLKDGVVTADISIRSVRREFPAAEALSAQIGLNALNTESLWVRAPVGYGPSQQELKGLSTLDPKTTEDFYNRAGEMLRKREPDKALADFDEVLRREPAMAQAHLGRALAYMRKGELTLALTDLDEALKAQPDYLAALEARAETRYLAHSPGALDDASEAVRRAPNLIGPLNSRGALYLRLGQPAAALGDFDSSLKINPENFAGLEGRARAHIALGQGDLAGADISRVGETADILNERCFSRAVANVTLDQALLDCDAALRLSPAAPQILDSRGFVRFRRGEFALAIADLDAALRFDPKLAESLYVRGLAKRRLGDAGGAMADIAAAQSLDATVAQTYADFGVVN